MYYSLDSRKWPVNRQRVSESGGKKIEKATSTTMRPTPKEWARKLFFVHRINRMKGE